jgi:hypothetical protein
VDAAVGDPAQQRPQPCLELLLEGHRPAEASVELEGIGIGQPLYQREQEARPVALRFGKIRLALRAAAQIGAPVPRGSLCRRGGRWVRPTQAQRRVRIGEVDGNR